MFAAHALLLAYTKPVTALPSAGSQTAYVATSQNTTSSSYTDLTTTTDQVTVTVGSSGTVLVIIQSSITSTNVQGSRALSYVSYAASGANTISASDNYSIGEQNFTQLGGGGFLVTGLTAGSTIFKMKYRCSSGTGTFGYRRITVVPL